VRPPGHHAQPDRADGFCLFNNTALAAERARLAGAERVAVIDWDVHHGNGTQACFYVRRDVLTISLHMPHGAWGPTHAQTGSAFELGDGDALGFNVNVELPLGTGDRGYAQAMRELVVPIVDQYEPDMLVLAVGQDASQFDPSGRQCLSMEGFRRVGEAAGELAARHTGGRAILVQEGGYAPAYSAYCLHATLAGLLGRPLELAETSAYLPDDPRTARPGIDAVKAAHTCYWRLP
jgi:acetoin utilization deacetylase AcuC-like enzyme